ncbi:MAG: hypothetical protein ACSLFR_16870 [Solirubrobacteraceae bacterium]
MSALRRVALALLVLGASLIAAPAPVFACGGVRHASARSMPDKAGRAPLIIGDSTLLLTVSRFGRLGIEADARGCRQFSEGLRILRARRARGSLPAVVIVALGANGPIARGQVGEALRIIGRRRILVLVTPRNSGASRARMRAAARAHPDRVVVADWRRHSARRGGWFAGDGLHVSHSGSRGFARFVRRAVAPLAFPPVKALRLPRHSDDARKACGRVRRRGDAVRVFVIHGASRLTCRRARSIARRPALAGRPGWTVYDVRRTDAGPWTWVLARGDRRAVIGIVG